MDPPVPQWRQPSANRRRHFRDPDAARARLSAAVQKRLNDDGVAGEFASNFRSAGRAVNLQDRLRPVVNEHENQQK